MLINPTTPGLQAAAAGVSVLANATKGVTVSASGVELKTDGTTVGFDGSGNLKSLFAYTAFVANEAPTGSINGSNTSFTLAHTPVSSDSVSKINLFLDGVMLVPGSGNDYTISGTTITMITVPQTGDNLVASYWY